MVKGKAVILCAILSILSLLNCVYAAEPSREPVYDPFADTSICIRVRIMEFLSPQERQDLAQVDRSFRSAHLATQKSLTFRPHDLPTDLNGALARFPHVTSLNFHGISFNTNQMSIIINAAKLENRITQLCFYGCSGLEHLPIDTVFSSLTEIGSTTPFHNIKLPQGLSLTKLDWSENFKRLANTFSRKLGTDSGVFAVYRLSTALTSIPLNRLRKFMEHTDRLSTGRAGVSTIMLIEALTKFSLEERTDAFIAQVERLTAGMNGGESASFIKALVEVPSRERPQFIEQAERLLTVEMYEEGYRVVILAQLANFPLSERPQFIERSLIRAKLQHLTKE